jgi:heat shock protein beta
MSPQMQRFMKAQAAQRGTEDMMMQGMAANLEINSKHPVITKLKGMVGEGAEVSGAAVGYAELLYDVAAVSSGYELAEPATFAKRIVALMGGGESELATMDEAKAAEAKEADTKQADAKEADAKADEADAKEAEAAEAKAAPREQPAAQEFTTESAPNVAVAKAAEGEDAPDIEVVLPVDAKEAEAKAAEAKAAEDKPIEPEVLL